MDEATIALTIMSLGLFSIFIGLFIWGFKSGQFKNIEEPKYRMLKNSKNENERRNKNARTD